MCGGSSYDAMSLKRASPWLARHRGVHHVVLVYEVMGRDEQDPVPWSYLWAAATGRRWRQRPCACCEVVARGDGPCCKWSPIFRASRPYEPEEPPFSGAGSSQAVHELVIAQRRRGIPARQTA